MQSLEETLGLPTTHTYHSNTTKMTKTLRKAIIMQNLLAGTFNRQTLQKQFGCGDRAFRRDLSEIASELEAPLTDQMKILRAICAEKLTTYAAQDEIPASVMAKILVAGETKKLEVKEEYIEKHELNVTIAEYTSTIERIVNSTLSTNNTEKPMDNTQTNPETSRIPT